MSDKYCCVTWRELSEELKETKENEIYLTISDKGIPKSVFASVLKVLNSMALYCPVCGSGLTEETKKTERVNIPPRKAVAPSAPAPTQVYTTCTQCMGRPSAVKCNTCLGTGKIKQARQIDPAKLSQLEDLKQTVIKPYSKELEEQQMKELEDEE